MAIERPPKYAFMNPEGLKMYRPPDENVATWHTVSSGRLENFSTIADRHRVPVEKIIGLNFPGSVENGRVIPEIVNWYLHHHRAFGGPETHNHLNRMFKGGEKIAIPYISNVEIGAPILGKKKEPVPLDDFGNIFASEKFAHEFKIPPKEPADLGYLLAQARISIEGEILQQQGGLIKTQFKKDQIKVQLEKKLSDDLKGTFSLKVDDKTMKKVAEEIGKGSKEGFARALAAPFEASLKQSYKFGRFAIVPELGAEFSLTPVIVRVAGECQDTLLVDGMMLKGKFVVKVGFNVGLSKKGWAWVVEKIGPEALKQFLANARGALAGLWEYLVAEGIVLGAGVAVGAVVGTVAITCLMAWLVADAKRKGVLRSYSACYRSAYLAKVFGRPRPSMNVSPDAGAAVLELIVLGEKDAVATAVNIVRRRNETGTYTNDAAALERYKSIAVFEFGGEAEAERRLTLMLERYMDKQLGL